VEDTDNFPTEPELPNPVLIVEDDPLQIRRLEDILGTLGFQKENLDIASSLSGARNCIARRSPQLAVVDLGLPDGNGLDLIPQLHMLSGPPGILVISAWGTREFILSALRAGATGYLLKERDDLELTISIRSVLRGGAPIDPFIAQRLINELKHAEPAEEPAPTEADSESEGTLSSREEQILRLVAKGLSNREIAEQLFLSRYTVESHIKHIYRKLAVSSRTRAIHAARSHGLLD